MQDLKFIFPAFAKKLQWNLSYVGSPTVCILKLYSNVLTVTAIVTYLRIEIMLLVGAVQLVGKVSHYSTFMVSPLGYKKYVIT